VIRKGKRRDVQRYQCVACGANFQNKRRKQKLLDKIQNEYIFSRQTAQDLGEKYHRSRKWVLQQLKEVNGDDSNIINISPRSIVVVADATFFSRTNGMLIFREPNLKRNLIWKEIHVETAGQYEQLKLELESLGFDIKAVILDGRPGIREVFSGKPTQMCQFHQVAIIRRYLTSRPKLEAAQELMAIARQLTKSDEKCFSELLIAWHNKWQDFLKEKTINPFTGRWFYTHKRLRAAFRSLKNNFPYLFTYKKYPELNIPNTTNSLDGYISTLKNLLNVHRGQDRNSRNKIICQILKK
jgi:hypothetical protein